MHFFKRTENVYIRLYVAFGLCLRLIYFIINLFIGGYHIDEAMLGINAFTLSNGLTDAAGEKLPLYFDTWLTGGQSPLPTYLTALSVKIFGMNAVSLRLPTLIISILGFLAFCSFVYEVFDKEKERIILIGIACVSPWLIFTGTFVLDCNYLAHALIFAFLFIAKAIKSSKLRYYAVSMVFFASGLYCYIASVLLIPPILAVIFLTLLIKKKIKIKECAVSVTVFVITAIPFIIFGLISVGYIKDFTLLGFSFSKMPYYNRADSVAFSNGGISAYLSNGLNNAFFSILNILVDLFGFRAIGLNIFQYGNTLCGMFVIIAIISFALSLIKNRKKYTFLQKLFALSFFFGIIFFCFNVNEPILAYHYRYGVLTYMLLFYEGIGIASFLSILKKADYKKVISVYAIIVLIVFNYQFFGIYKEQTKITGDIIYGDSLFTCLDEAETIEHEKIEFVDDIAGGQKRTSVYCRFYHCIKSDYNSFTNLGDEFRERLINNNMNQSLTKNGNISFTTSSDCSFSDKNIYIIRTELLPNLNGIPKNYTVKNNGSWSMIYKH